MELDYISYMFDRIIEHCIVLCIQIASSSSCGDELIVLSKLNTLGLFYPRKVPQHLLSHITGAGKLMGEILGLFFRVHANVRRMHLIRMTVETIKYLGGFSGSFMYHDMCQYHMLSILILCHCHSERLLNP